MAALDVKTKQEHMVQNDYFGKEEEEEAKVEEAKVEEVKVEEVKEPT